MRPSKRCKWRIFRLDTSLQDFLQRAVLYNFCKKSLWIFFYNFFKLLFRTIFRKCSLWIVYFKFCLLWFHIKLFVNFANCSSQPSMVHWLSSPIFPFLVVQLSRHGDTRPNLTSTCPTPPNPYIFWKLMIIAIQKWIGNTNTKTKTNTKTMTKTKTPRGQLNH